ncbi:hypothetical protein H4582DRAFT_1397319 [Lactarius indigo]|nr:hypothetical protein H4582DRAFT_1397319 [Lactarius indigo]
MSRSATVSTSKNPPQLPSKSAWARGPRATTTPSRLQSPATPTPVSVTNPPNFHATHSRRSRALGQGVSIKVDIPRSAVKQASVPAMKPADGVKSFGSVAVQNGNSDAAKSAVTDRPLHLSSPPSTSPFHPATSSTSALPPVPKFDKKSIAKLFAGPSTQSVSSPPAMWSGHYHHPQFVPGVPPDLPSVAPPPSIPPTVSRPASLSANAGAFVPGKKISIKHPHGQEVNLDALKRLPPPATPIIAAVPPSPAPVKKKKKKRLVLIESQEQKERRLAEEKAGVGESGEKDRTSESFANANEDAARCRINERELREVEERELKEAERIEEEWKEVEAWAEERAEERSRKLRGEEARAAVGQRCRVEESLKAAEAAAATGTLADATSDAKPDPLPEGGEIEDETDK